VWVEDPRTWIPLAAIAAQGVISWWRVGEQDKDIKANKEHCDRELALLRAEKDHELQLVRVDVDSLREWRAQAREKLQYLERRREPRDKPPEDEDE